jgi:signal transduction histidine kinase/CheY-like chemotaxis protein
MVADKPGVLIVDDRPANRSMLARALSTLDVAIHEAASGPEALDIVDAGHELFVALLDVRMPGMDGYSLAEAMRRSSRTATLPIIFISAVDTDAYHHSRGYETGAVDFLNKPVSPRILLSKVRVFLDLYRQRRELESLVKRLDGLNVALSRQTLRLETTAEVTHQIASILDLDQLLSEILGLIRERFTFPFAGIWLRERDAQRTVLRLHAGHYGTPDPIREPGIIIPLDAPRSIIAYVARTKTPYLTNNAMTDAHYLLTDDVGNIQAELALPLVFGDAVLGVLDIQSDAPGAFVPEDVAALTSLADQIAIAMRNARLYLEVRRLNEGLEAEVRERTEQLETAYRHLELLDRRKSDFITVVSHELRTPLTLINGFGRLLQQDPLIVEDERRLQEVKSIVSGATRMRAIVDSMLDVVEIDSRTLQLRPEPVLVAEILKGLAEELCPALETRQLTLTYSEAENLSTIEADRESLTKAFRELLSNAVKYTPDGGDIRVSGRELVSGNQDLDPYVEVIVEDSGIGIAPEFQELIFAKFYRTGEVTLHSSSRTKFKGGGPGLGLAIVRGIVEAHGGHVWAESPGHDEARLPGSKFHVVLPRRLPRDSQTQRPPVSST